LQKQIEVVLGYIPSSFGVNTIIVKVVERLEEVKMSNIIRK